MLHVYNITGSVMYVHMYVCVITYPGQFQVDLINMHVSILDKLTGTE